MPLDENDSYTRASRAGLREFSLGHFEEADYFFKVALEEESWSKFFLPCYQLKQSSCT